MINTCHAYLPRNMTGLCRENTYGGVDMVIIAFAFTAIFTILCSEYAGSTILPSSNTR